MSDQNVLPKTKSMLATPAMSPIWCAQTVGIVRYPILLDSFGCANTRQHTDALKILFSIEVCDLEHTRCHHTLLPLLSVRTLGIRRRKI